MALVVKERELRDALDRLKRPPQLVVTDSQAFLKVAADTPPEVPLTSFSHPLRALQGRPRRARCEGTLAVDDLKTRRPASSSPRPAATTPSPRTSAASRSRAGSRSTSAASWTFEHMQGHDFPDDLSPLRPRDPLRRLHVQPARDAGRASCAAARPGVPITNYGLVIAYSLGIFERALQPFPAALEAMRAAQARRAGHAPAEPVTAGLPDGRRRRRPLLMAGAAACAAPSARAVADALDAADASRASHQPGCARPTRRGSRRCGPRPTRRGAATSATRSTSAASSRSATTACAAAPTAASAPATAASSATACPAEVVLACARKARGVRLRHAGHAVGRGLRHRDRVDGRRAAPHQAPRPALAAITLSLGERPDEDLAAWREAGADRYLLRFETSDDELYRRIHPDLPGKVSDRMAILRRLQELGYEAGTGIMVGIPGQTHASIADDIELFRGMDMDMIGIGPYLPHPATPLGQEFERRPARRRLAAGPGAQQRAHDLQGARAHAPRAPGRQPAGHHGALAGQQGGGRAHGLQRGANVVMPNLTPLEDRAKYEIYPEKAAVHETAEAINDEHHGAALVARPHRRRRRRRRRLTPDVAPPRRSTRQRQAPGAACRARPRPFRCSPRSAAAVPRQCTASA